VKGLAKPTKLSDPPDDPANGEIFMGKMHALAEAQVGDPKKGNHEEGGASGDKEGEMKKKNRNKRKTEQKEKEPITSSLATRRARRRVGKRPETRKVQREER
jgi:hypothetical protein